MMRNILVLHIWSNFVIKMYIHTFPVPYLGCRVLCTNLDKNYSTNNYSIATTILLMIHLQCLLFYPIAHVQRNAKTRAKV